MVEKRNPKEVFGRGAGWWAIASVCSHGVLETCSARQTIVRDETNSLANTSRLCGCKAERGLCESQMLRASKFAWDKLVPSLVEG